MLVVLEMSMQRLDCYQAWRALLLNVHDGSSPSGAKWVLGSYRAAVEGRAWLVAVSDGGGMDLAKYGPDEGYGLRVARFLKTRASRA